MNGIKGMGIFLVLIIFSGFISSQEVFGFTEPGTKEEKQLMSGVFLIGFVVVYGGIIYLNKSSEIKSIKKIVFN
jgi:hypothetical protein